VNNYLTKQGPSLEKVGGGLWGGGGGVGWDVVFCEGWLGVACGGYFPLLLSLYVVIFRHHSSNLLSGGIQLKWRGHYDSTVTNSKSKRGPGSLSGVRWLGPRGTMSLSKVELPRTS